MQETRPIVPTGEEMEKLRQAFFSGDTHEEMMLKMQRDVRPGEQVVRQVELRGNRHQRRKMAALARKGK